MPQCSALKYLPKGVVIFRRCDTATAAGSRYCAHHNKQAARQDIWLDILGADWAAKQARVLARHGAIDKDARNRALLARVSAVTPPRAPAPAPKPAPPKPKKIDYLDVFLGEADPKAS